MSDSTGTSSLGVGEYLITVRADQAISNLQSFENSAKDTESKVKTSMSSMALSMTGLAASSASLYFSFDQLERASTRVEQGHLRVERAQAQVNKLQAEGKTGTDEYQRALQNLQIQQERYDMAQKMVSENMVFMGLSMVTMATSTIPTVIKAVQGLSISVEALGAAIDTVAPYLLVAVAAFAAYEGVVAPLIKEHYGLNVSIIDNVDSFFKQKMSVDQNTAAFTDLTGAMDGAISSDGMLGSSMMFMGDSISTTRGKVDELSAAFSELKNTENGFATSSDAFAGGEVLLTSTDQLSKILEQKRAVSQYKSDLQAVYDSGITGQAALNVVTEHYQNMIIQNVQTHNLSTDALNEQLRVMKDEVTQAEKLVELESKRASIVGSSKKKVDEYLDSIGLAAGATSAIFGNAFNPELDRLFNAGVRDFGSGWEALHQGLSRGLPFVESVMNSIAGPNGTNTSSPVGGLHNNDMHNFLTTLIANEHMFGSFYPAVKDFNRQAVNNGEAYEQSVFEQDSPEWQKFYALRQIGAFKPDSSLSLDANLRKASQQYDDLYAGLRGDVASSLLSSHSSTRNYRLGADARNPGIAATEYHYKAPTADELALARTDSLFSSESAFQNMVGRVKSELGLDLMQYVKVQQGTGTFNDIQSELDYIDRQNAIGSGASY